MRIAECETSAIHVRFGKAGQVNLINRVDIDQSVCSRSASGCEGSIIAEAKRLYAIGLCPIPVRYVGDKCRRPAGLSIEKFEVWSLVETMFHDFGRKHGRIDALAVWIGQNTDGIVWLDIDSTHERNEWLRRASCAARELPRVRTRRGLHVVCRLEGIESRIDLRKYKFDGELLYGNQQIVIVPPSTHRSDNQVSYRWEVDLPAHVSKIPQLTLCELIPKLTENESHAHLKIHIEKTKVNPLGPSIPKASSARVRDQSGVGQGSVRLALDRSMPSATGQTRIKLPVYVRSLKRIRKEWSREQIEEAARLWWLEAKRRKVTCEPIRGVIDLVFRLFESYDSTKSGAISDAIEFVESSREYFNAHSDSLFRGRRNRDSLLMIMRVCYALSLTSQSREFFISAGDAGEIVNASKTTGWNLLNALVAEGVLTVIKPGKPVRGEDATVYRFNVSESLSSIDHEQIRIGSCSDSLNSEHIAATVSRRNEIHLPQQPVVDMGAKS